MIHPFDGEDEVVDLANESDFGLDAQVFTEDLLTTHRVFPLRGGTVWVNCSFIRDLRAPFGGVGASGVGREGWKLLARVLQRAQGRDHADRGQAGAINACEEGGWNSNSGSPAPSSYLIRSGGDGRPLAQQVQGDVDDHVLLAADETTLADLEE